MLIKVSTDVDKPRTEALTHGGRLWGMLFARGLTAEGEIDVATGESTSPFGAQGWPYPAGHPTRRFMFTVLNVNRWESGFCKLIAVFTTFADKKNNPRRILRDANFGPSYINTLDFEMVRCLRDREVAVFAIPVGMLNAKDSRGLLRLIYGNSIDGADILSTGGAIERMHRK